MNQSETARAADGSFSLIHEMNKYNFKESYKVSVEIIKESDTEVFSTERDKREQSLEQTNGKHGNTQTTNTYIQNTCNNPTTNTVENCNNSNVAMAPYSNENVETQYDSRNDSWLTNHLHPNSRSISDHTTVINYGPPPSYPDVNLNVEQGYLNDLKILSKKLIDVLKACSFYNNVTKNTQLSEVCRTKAIRTYCYIKQKIFDFCQDIVFRRILQRGTRFNHEAFISETMYIANIEEKFSCTYEAVKCIYDDLMRTCYTNEHDKNVNIRRREEQQNLESQTYNNSRPILQQTQYDHQYLNNTQTVNNGSNTILQQAQNNLQYNNVNQLTYNGSNFTIQQRHNDLQYNNVMQRTSQDSNCTLQQTQNGLPYNNVMQRTYHGSNSTFQQTENVQEYNNIMQTTSNGSTSMLPQTRNDLQYNKIMQTSCQGSNSTFQKTQKDLQCTNIIQTSCNELTSMLAQTQNVQEYTNIMQKTSHGSSSTLSQTGNGLQNKKIKKKTYKKSNQILQENVKNIESDSNRRQDILKEKIPDVPTTCIFKYNCPNYEIRMDVNSDLLDNLKQNNNIQNDLQDSSTTNKQGAINSIFPSQSSQKKFQKGVLQGPDSPFTKDQCSINSSFSNQKSENKIHNNLQGHELSSINEQCATNSSFSKPISPNYGVSNMQQELTRSTSRDSGFISPCNNQIISSSDLSNGEGFEDDLTSPYITNVTSLSSEAIHIPPGICHVCGVITNSKCAGCFNYYYCSNSCQNRHWAIHKYYCKDPK